MMRILVLAFLCVVLPVAAQQVETVATVDLNRYLGKWVEIARLPNKFQTQCVANVSAEYRLRADGDLDVINRCQKADALTDEAIGRAKLVDVVTNAKLKVRFAPAWLAWLPQVWGDYWILDLAADYSVAAVGEPSHTYLWILARTPSIPEPVYSALLARLQRQGFNTEKIVKTVQVQSVPARQSLE